MKISTHSTFLLIVLLFTCFQSIESIDDNEKYDEQLAKRFLLYSSISYCENESVIKNWTCNACYGDLYFQKTALVVDNDTATFGFIGSTRVVGEEHAIVIAFRGTNPSDLKNVNVDIKVIPTEIDEVVKGATVHTGFWEAWRALSDDLIPPLQKLMKYFDDPKNCDQKFPRRPKIYFTGHSLGAALATCALVDLTSRGIINHVEYPLSLYTFGSPRVGNHEFAEYAASVLRGSFRVIHNMDIVTTLPPKSLLGFGNYEHLPKGVRYNEDFTEFVVCENDAENGTCNPWGIYGTGDHMTYLNMSVGGYCETAKIPEGAKFVVESPEVCKAGPSGFPIWGWALVAVGAASVLGLVVGLAVWMVKKHSHRSHDDFERAGLIQNNYWNKK
eukprot:TRINITY_DN5951_c0_g1_i1.p1 TRINITY_DN5951_c0_g1~~TRINITY_DN5951_c0_g1_i1.p1  ORF type:complete len:386 (+),score=99.12 TRINITY_DN5951_c0_g1_i1:88-1245(+)